MSIDADDLRILHHVEQACSQTGVEWMLVGALARDIHLIDIAGIVPSRATNDVDIAVAVESWETFAALKESLIESRKFVISNNAQRLLGVDDLDGRQLDIVPFGEGIRDASSLIRWPPDAAVVMSVAGFEEAFKVDRKAPTLSISSPVANSSFGLGAVVNAAYSCADSGSGLGPIDACSGTVANGASIDTATPGPKSFQVTSVDAVGNAVTTTVAYTVVSTTYSRSPPTTTPGYDPSASRQRRSRSGARCEASGLGRHRLLLCSGEPTDHGPRSSCPIAHSLLRSTYTRLRAPTLQPSASVRARRAPPTRSHFASGSTARHQHCAV